MEPELHRQHQKFKSADMPTSKPTIAYYSPCLQGTPAMAVMQRLCGGTFVSNRKSTIRVFKKLYPDVKAMRRHRHLDFIGGHQILKKADVIFSSATYGKYLPQFSAKKCMLFHGTFGSIPESMLVGWKDFDHLFLNGPRMERHLLRYNEKYNLNYTVVGHIPFALYPERTEENRLLIIQKLGLDPNKKTVVYTPSKSIIGTWLHCAEDIAKETPKNYNLILRPHPNQVHSGKSADRASFKRVNRIVEQRQDSLIDLSICSLPELECVADLIISDANSPAEESLFYDCPQLFADANQSSRSTLREYMIQDQIHEEDIESFLELFDCGPSRYADGFENWAEAINYAVSHKDRYATARSKTYKYIFGERGTNAAKLAKNSLEQLNLQ